jgi:HPt (histidine-containing phosphotransfer) domain-containing protein
MFLANGFQDFLSKPIDIIRMDEVINTWVRDKDKERELNLIPGADESSTDTGFSDAISAVLNGARVEGLDIASGLARFSGDEDAYVSTLRSYAQNTAPLIDAIREVTEENLPQIAVTVHGIKGSSFSISADAIGKQAEKLEHAAKAGDLAFVSGNIAAFIDATEGFLAALNELLAQVQAAVETDKDVLEQPDSQLLADMAQACETYQMDEIDRLLAELGHYRYQRGAELVAWIENELAQGEFSHVADKLMSRQ